MILKLFIVVDANIAAIVVRIHREVIPDRLGDLVENRVDPSPKFYTYDFAWIAIFGLTIGDILELPAGRFIMRFLFRCRIRVLGLGLSLGFRFQQSLLAYPLSFLFSTSFAVESGINLERMADIQPDSEGCAVQASLTTLQTLVLPDEDSCLISYLLLREP